MTATHPEPRPAYQPRCYVCKTPARYSDLNDDMECENCGDPEPEDEDMEDLLAEHGTWRASGGSVVG